ncbi:MAG: phage holin [Eubacterium sp.]
MKTDKNTIIRTVILFISLVNAVLQMLGIKAIPIENELVSEAVSVIFLLAGAISSWWYNNSFTEKAKAADEYLKELRNNEAK